HSFVGPPPGTTATSITAKVVNPMADPLGSDRSSPDTPPRSSLGLTRFRRGLHGSDRRLGGRFLVLFARHLGNRRDAVPLLEVHDAHALRVATDHANLPDVRAVDHAAGRDEHDVVVAHRRHADHGTIAFAGADVAQALAAAALLAVAHRRAVLDDLAFALRGWLLVGLFDNVLGLPRGRFLGAGSVGPKRRPLAKALFTDGEQEALRVGDHHADDLVALLHGDALDAFGIAAHRAGLGLVEADGHAEPRAEQHLVTRLRQGHVNQGVPLFETNADDAALLGPAVVFQRRLLDQAASRRHQQVIVALEATHRNHAGDLLLGLERQHVGDGPADAGPAHFRDVMHLQPVQLAAVGEAQQIRVCRGDEEVFDEIVVALRSAGDAFAAAVLAAVRAQRQPFDIAVVAKRDGVHFLGEQVLPGEVFWPRVKDLGAPLVAELVGQFQQVGANDGPDLGLVGQQFFVADDVPAQVVVLLDDLVALQGSELAQLQTDNGLGLGLGHAVAVVNAEFALQGGEVVVAQGPL